MTEPGRDPDRGVTQVFISIPHEKPRKATDALDVVRDILEQREMSTRDRLFITDVIEGLSAFVDQHFSRYYHDEARAAGIDPNTPGLGEIRSNVKGLLWTWSDLREARKKRDKDPIRSRQAKGEEDMSRLIEEVSVLKEKFRLCERAQVRFLLE